MNSNWQELLGTSGARAGSGMLADFGDIPAELVAARDATIVSPLTHLGLIECAGDDAKAFLHNQLTSDINHLAPGFAQHSAWCTAKGRMLASFLLYRNGTDYRALLSCDLVSTIQKRLQMFVLRSKVKVLDLSGTHLVFGLSGPQAEAALQSAGFSAPASALQTAVFADGAVIRLDGARLILVVANDVAMTTWKKITSIALPASTPVWQWLDVQAGVPLITEATKEAFVPQMANFDKIDAVSFHKGCYPGQEVVARTQYLGKVKRHLYRIHVNGMVAPGTAIHASGSPEQPCGTVSNAAPAPGGGCDALAVIQESFVETGALHLDMPDGLIVAIEPVVS